MSAPLSHTAADDHTYDLVSADSLVAKAVGLWAFLPGNAGAFLLQVMHPTIGDVVGKYSVYRTDPFGRAIRSIDSVNLWVYGELDGVAEGNRLRRLHQPLQMVNTEGKRISALNPQPFGWVPATGYATTVWMWQRLFGRELTLSEQDEIFADFRRVASILQVPAGHFPESRAEYWSYFDDIVATTLVNHPVAQDIITNQLRGSVAAPPQLPSFLEPLWRPVGVAAGRSLYLLALSLLPGHIRDILEVEWSASDEAAASALWMTLRLTTKLLPDQLIYTPVAYHSLRRAAAIRAIKQRAVTSIA